MGAMLDALKQIELGTSATPVILPLTPQKGEGRREKGEKNNDECRMMNDECSASAALAPGTSSVHHTSFIIHHSPERFTFPAVPEPREQPPAPKSPMAVWPECHDPEMARACAGLADKMLRQLSLDRPKVVAFTSPGDGDGKTSLLAALAPQLAKRVAGGVLAVDANLRKPDLTARLQMPPGDPPAGALLVYPTNLQRLSVLPAPRSWANFPVAPGSAASLSCRRAEFSPPGYDRLWIEQLREGWSLVLLDTASLAQPEASPLIRHCDGVYLVVRLGHTARRAIGEAARAIRNSGGRLLGCAVVK
jgi:Mrp family chromosome partitioning ATPase